MIRTYNKQTVVVENGVTKYLADIFCNSTDTKPTANLVNGSKLTEVDTGKTFLYDEANTEWVEYAEGGGEGGTVVVTFTDVTPVSETEFTSTASMTGAEILDAILAGKSVNAVVDGRLMSMGVMQIPIYASTTDVSYVWGMSIIGWNPSTLLTSRIAYLKISYANATATLELTQN